MNKKYVYQVGNNKKVKWYTAVEASENITYAFFTAVQ
jgi:hypothetical protein